MDKRKNRSKAYHRQTKSEEVAIRQGLRHRTQANRYFLTIHNAKISCLPERLAEGGTDRIGALLDRALHDGLPYALPRVSTLVLLDRSFGN